MDNAAVGRTLHTVRGGAARLWERILSGDAPQEHIIEGPAGTGKTIAIGLLVYTLMMRHPGTRCVMLRKVRADLADSAMRTFENFVLGPGHPVLRNGPNRRNRSSYLFPNGSEVVIAGLDRDTRLFSAEYDIVWVNELIEIGEGNWEYLSRSLRNFRCPLGQFKIGDTNPGHPSHWVNQRAGKDQCARYISRHKDNPAYYDPETGWTKEGIAYLQNLQAFSGVRRERMLHGKWVAAEDAIWPEYDAGVHIRPRSEFPKDRIRYYIGGQDFGMTTPGAFQVWGVEKTTNGDRLWLVHEVYAQGKPMEWWSDHIIAADNKYQMARVVCDHEPPLIDAQNKALGYRTGRAGRALCVPARKSRDAGIQIVRTLLNPTQPGGPRILILEDALVDRDSDLAAMRKPCRLTDEIDSYVYRKMRSDDNKPIDEPDPNCVDHGCDTMRYVAAEVFLSQSPNRSRAYQRANSPDGDD